MHVVGAPPQQSPAMRFDTHSTPQPNRSSLKRPGSLNPLPPLSSSSQHLAGPVRQTSLNPYGVIPQKPPTGHQIAQSRSRTGPAFKSNPNMPAA